MLQAHQTLKELALAEQKSLGKKKVSDTVMLHQFSLLKYVVCFGLCSFT
jgi:hypothetical protein